MFVTLFECLPFDYQFVIVFWMLHFCKHALSLNKFLLILIANNHSYETISVLLFHSVCICPFM